MPATVSEKLAPGQGGTTQVEYQYPLKPRLLTPWLCIDCREPLQADNNNTAITSIDSHL
ncbi:MAG: hypothetical protein JWR61_4829 [Ferruginibacter sp.]|nr:hypothetical protein [Ferruginibacter sp.]